MVSSEAMGTGFNDPGGAASSGSSSGELPSVPATLVNKHNLDVRWEGSLWSPRKRPANLKSNKVQNMELRHVDVFLQHLLKQGILRQQSPGALVDALNLGEVEGTGSLCYWHCLQDESRGCLL